MNGSQLLQLVNSNALGTIGATSAQASRIRSELETPSAPVQAVPAANPSLSKPIINSPDSLSSLDAKPYEDLESPKVDSVPIAPATTQTFLGDGTHAVVVDMEAGLSFDKKSYLETSKKFAIVLSILSFIVVS